jgi:SAM-dependent methyltransferase
VANIALQTEIIDRPVSLAGLHHITEKIDVFQEAHRVLVPGGRIVVADVLDGTAVALFMSDSVDRLTETGHKGQFIQGGELTFLLRASGFENVSEQHVHFTWHFPDRKTLVWSCRQLFGLVKTGPAEVEAELGRFSSIHEGDGIAHLPWSLTYAAATKPVRKVISDDRGKHGVHLRFGRHGED